MDFNVTGYEKFIDRILDYTLQLTFQKYPLSSVDSYQRKRANIYWVLTTCQMLCKIAYILCYDSFNFQQAFDRVLPQKQLGEGFVTDWEVF